MKHGFSLLFYLFLLGNIVISLGLSLIVYEEHNIYFSGSLIVFPGFKQKESKYQSRWREMCEFNR